MAWIAFATLTALELVLGIDNIIFIAILVERLPPLQAARARRIGLALALFLRIAMLALLSWMAGLIAPLFTLFGNEISGRDIVLIGGGLFLLGKSTHEIHGSMQAEPGERAPQARGRGHFGQRSRAGNPSRGKARHLPRVLPHHGRAAIGPVRSRSRSGAGL